MAAEARRLAPEPVVAGRSPGTTTTSADRLAVRDLPPWCHDRRRSFAHLVAMSDGIGHVRARRARRAAARARLLHRRHGPSAGRRRAGSPTPDGSALELAGTAFRFLADAAGRRPVASGTGGPRAVDGTAAAGSRTAGGAACGRSARPRAARPEEWMRQQRRSYFDHGARAAVAAPAVDGVRRARRRRGARRRSLYHDSARSLLADAVDDDRSLGRRRPSWPWPEPRLDLRQRGDPRGADRRGSAARPTGRARRRARPARAGCSRARPSTTTCHPRRSAVPGRTITVPRSTSNPSRSRRSPTPVRACRDRDR